MPIPVLVCRCPDDDASMSPRPNRDLTTGPISRNLLLFSLPILGGNAAQSLNGSVNAVWIGRHLSDPEAKAAIKGGVTAVLDLTCESSEAPPFLSLAYCPLPILDLTAPTTAQLEAAIRESVRKKFVDMNIQALHAGARAAGAGPGAGA